MPQDAAKIFANEYKNKLSHYGSFRGLLKIIKSIKSNEVKEDKIDDDNKTTKKDPLYLIDMNKFSVSN
ncbi:MAG: hypothetical protein JXA54_00810 [Candidatus Heimdallarchaeota archaeon]|nr:hypothetical protein [Candidatus Heimdallarchaeota archaeon]